jgi:membrane-associated phospholipid phosphatase
MSFFEWLDQADKAIFTAVHTKFSSPWVDKLMLLLRNAVVWIPLYAFMLFWALKRGLPAGIKFILLTVLCFAITDYTSASIFKPYFERLRPCYDEDTSGLIRGIIGCGGKFSFPSSHASNHFGLAAFWYYSVYFLTRQRWIWVWVWAFMIGLAQVYVGKHFPLDIAGGAVLGIFTGTALAILFENWVKHDLRKPLNTPSFDLP